MKDEEKEANSKLKEVSVPEILEAQREEQVAKEEEEKVKTKARMKRGCADDLATLLELDPMIILDEVHARYNQDIIYVSCHEELSLSVVIL